MKRVLASVLVMMLLFSSFASYAVTSTEIAADLQEVYGYLEQPEKDFMSIVRTDLQGLDQSSWDSVLSDLMGEDLPDAVTQVEIQDFVLGLTQIYFNTNSATIADEIDQFKVDQEPLIDKLFGSSATIGSLMDLLYSTKGDIVNTLDGGEKLQLTTAADAGALIEAMEDVLQDAVLDEMNTNYTDLRDELEGIGWDIEMLLTAQNDLLAEAVITYGTEACVAVANATVRSKASVASGDITPTEGDTVTYSMEIFGQETNLFMLSSQSSKVTADGHSVIMDADGIATIYVHRLGGSTDPADYDYIHKFEITIDAKSSGSTGDSGTVAPPVSVDMDEVNDAAADLADTLDAVEGEAEAMAVVDAAGDLAQQLLNMVEGVETQDDIDDSIAGIVALSDAVSSVAGLVLDPDDAEDALAVQTNLIDSVLALLDVVEDEGTQLELIDSVQGMLASADELVALMDDPAAVEDFALDMIADAATMLALVPESNDLLDEMNAGVVDLAQSYVDVASTIVLGSGSTAVNPIGTAVTTLDEQQILDLAATSQDAIDAMTTALGRADVAVEHSLQVIVTIQVPEAVGAVHHQAVLPPSSSLPGLVDQLAIQFPAATVQISTEDLGLHMGDEMTIAASVVGNGSLTPQQEACLVDEMVVYEFDITTGGQPVTTFSQPLTISIPIAADCTMDPEEMTIFHLLSDGTMVPMGGHYVNGSLVYRAPHTSHYVIDEARKSFNDVTDKNWAKDYIELLAGKGIINGKADSVFDPYAPITRAEFTVMLMKAMAYNGVTGSLNFTDVKAGDWFAYSTAAAYQNGIVGGKGNNTFAPYDYITRQEMAKMISNVLVKENYKLSSDIPTQFSDCNSIAIWAIRDVDTAVREGIVNGMPNGSFMPTKNATRAEAATMVYQLFVK
jgi:uncharacterized membrane protein